MFESTFFSRSNCFEISMTPILERFYLGYRTGPWFAFILAAFFGLYFFCINGRWCDPIFSFMGSKMKTDDEVQTAAFFKTCGFVTTVTAAIFVVCCVLWAIIDFGMIVTGHMIDADGCPYKRPVQLRLLLAENSFVV